LNKQLLGGHYAQLSFKTVHFGLVLNSVLM